MIADNLVIGGMAAFSTVDYPQHLAATLFLQGCPWRCHYCHNPHLIPLQTADEKITWQQVRQHLEGRQGLLDAVVFSGGEPTIQKPLLAALRHTRAMGFRNGLHTGAPHLDLLRPLLPWLDWVGLDIKAMPSDYAAVTTRRHSGPQSWAAIEQLQKADVDFECRMTWHGELHSAEQVVEVGECLADRGVRRFAVQVARSDQMLNAQIGAGYISLAAKQTVILALDSIFECLELRG
ncbi:anaerobic ribonucleoside-triphosphate reductase activating protein [Halopseudomonas pelagia]|uniref:anaerobic ribonucleoside-triphosphate reductase activating protein n=1 Tax=Halopseudomonas pelagia TaxID=553151 RepID=UPI0003A9413D|nr:anaerobic ribonucleoside-triphosphate reductase activating protein [Halopseudomonas pelagia]|tara:strand:- start:310 stop:1014 length:705 start_codon:yes stop_codon:yes gene_type:complete